MHARTAVAMARWQVGIEVVVEVVVAQAMTEGVLVTMEDAQATAKMARWQVGTKVVIEVAVAQVIMEDVQVTTEDAQVMTEDA